MLQHIRKIFGWFQILFKPSAELNQRQKKVIYTCITNQYDHLLSHRYVSDEWDYICFTDNSELLTHGHPQWTIYPLQFTALDPARNSRWHKLFPDKILSDYDVSLYMDANINIIDPGLFNYINRRLLYKSKYTLSVHKHPFRNCAYKEAVECINLKLDDEAVIKQHMSKLKDLNYPVNNGLQENNVIYRRHHDATVKKIMEEWWWWICHHSRRDQLSLNYILWKNNFNIHVFKKQFVRNPRYAILLNHINRQN